MTYLKRITSNLKIEFIALPVLIAVLLVIIKLRFFTYIFLIVAMTAGTIFYIVMNYIDRKNADDGTDFSYGLSRNHKYILNILFFIVLSASMYSLLYSNYDKPMVYFILIAICTGIIAIEIIFVRTNTDAVVNLIKTYILGLYIFLNNQIVFPLGIGQADSYHLIPRFILPIVNTGYMPKGVSEYDGFPAHFILVAVDSIVTSISPKMTYYLLGGFGISIGIFLVYILGKRFVNCQFGLAAALVYINSDYLIFHASHASQLADAMPLLLISFTALLLRFKINHPGTVVLFIVPAVTLIFTHHHSPATFGFVLIAMLLAEVIYYRKDTEHFWITPGALKLFAVILLAQWLYYSYNFNVFVNVIDKYLVSFFSLWSNDASIAAPSFYESYIPLDSAFINTLGASILMFLSITGFYLFLRKTSFFKNAIMTVTLCLLMLLAMGVFINLLYVLPQRIYVFAEEIGFVFLAGFAVYYLIYNIRYAKQIVGLIFIISLAFFSNASGIAGFETSTLKGDIPYYKLFVEPQEISSLNWSNSHLNDNSTVYQSLSFNYYVYTFNVYNNPRIGYKMMQIYKSNKPLR